MVADQWKKRLRAINNIDCPLDRHGLKKKKKQGLARYNLKLRSNVSLVWDDKKRCVLAKKEQIGISQRELTPFLDSLSHHHSILADVFTLPHETFELNNLSEVLSHKVWQANLSEDERGFLTQFLPEGSGPDDIVYKLLGEENFHFGNQFLKWQESGEASAFLIMELALRDCFGLELQFSNHLRPFFYFLSRACSILSPVYWFYGLLLSRGQMICSGSFHPDNVMRQEQLFKSNKKAYYMELQNYHDNMIGKLQLWKESLESCKDSEEEMVERILRRACSTHDVLQRRGFRFAQDACYVTGCRKQGVYVLTLQDNCKSVVDVLLYLGVSWEGLDKLWWDGQLVTAVGTLRKGLTEGTYGSSPDGAKMAARSRKGEKLNKRNIQHSDGAKYMSYIKVSREHYQRVKNSMKHNSNSIQPRSLSNVLGDVENLHVQPFEFYEEEERQKLHDHWLQLANRDVPAGFAKWIKRRSQELHVRISLGQEMEQKLNVQIKGEEKMSSDGIFPERTDCKEAEERTNSDGIFAEQTDNKEAEIILSMEVEADQQEDNEKSDRLIEKQMEREIVNNEVSLQSEVDKHESVDESDGLIEKQMEREILNNELPLQSEVDQHEGEENSDGLIEKQMEREVQNNELPLQSEVDQHEGKEKSDGLIEKQMEREILNNDPIKSEVDQHEGKEESDGLIEKQMEREILNNELPIQPEDQEGGESASLFDEQTPDSTANTDYDDESLPVSLSQDLDHVSLDESNQLGHFKLDSNENNIIQQADEVSPTVSEYPEGLNSVDVPVDQGDPLASTSDGWPAISIAASYGCATPISHEYSSAEELSLGHPRVTEERAASLINLEAVPTGKDAGRDMLPREPSAISLFGSYPQNRNEIFHPFFKDPDSSSYNHEQRQSPLDFQPATNLMVQQGQYSGHFREQLHVQLPIELRHKGMNDLLMHQNFQGNLYPDGSRYSLPRHEQLNVGMQDWAINSVHVSTPPQTHLSSGDLLSQNWFSGENHARGSWSTFGGVGGPSQSIGSVNNSDQSLYSVLSECNALHQSGSYNVSGSRERLIPSRNYGEIAVGVPTTSNASQQQAVSLSYMSSQESPSGLKPNGLGWTSMSTQNPGYHDSMGKPFLRPWNP
ncbi:hypothetical protein MTR67_011092 [Solanum verrucosum]|uniref:Nuclear factor related to kappa-B-binding protein n=1 Tax=Solanum verrucosum TaxID=315347 RepID=A0AAF0TES7_SOLVR|nr:hypothetical protein MTR67_011092 [Solanum verrucosum]